MRIISWLYVLGVLAIPGYAHFDAAFKKKFPEIAVEQRFLRLSHEDKCILLKEVLSAPDLSEQQRIEIINERVIVLLNKKNFTFKKELLAHVGLETIVRWGTIPTNNLLGLGSTEPKEDCELLITLVEKDAVLCEKILSLVPPKGVVNILNRVGLENLFKKYGAVLNKFMVSIRFPWHDIKELKGENLLFFLTHLDNAVSHINTFSEWEELECQKSRHTRRLFFEFLLDNISIPTLEKKILPYARNILFRNDFDSYFSRQKFFKFIAQREQKKIWDLIRAEPTLLKILINPEKSEKNDGILEILTLRDILNEFSFSFIKEHAETEWTECFKNLKNTCAPYDQVRILFDEKTYAETLAFIKESAGFRDIFFNEIGFEYPNLLSVELLNELSEFFSLLSVKQLLEIDRKGGEKVTHKINTTLLARDFSEVADFLKSLNGPKNGVAMSAIEKFLTLFPEKMRGIFYLGEDSKHDFFKFSSALFAKSQELLLDTFGLEILDGVSPVRLLQFFSYDAALKMPSGNEIIEKVETMIKNWTPSQAESKTLEACFLRKAFSRKSFFYNMFLHMQEFVKLHWDWETFLKEADSDVLNVMRDIRFALLSEELLRKFAMPNINNVFKKKLIQVFSLKRLLELKDFTVDRDFVIELRKEGLLPKRDAYAAMKRINKAVDWANLDATLKRNLGRREGIQGRDIKDNLELLSGLFLDHIPANQSADALFARASAAIGGWIQYAKDRFSLEHKLWGRGLQYMQRAKTEAVEGNLFSIRQVFVAMVSLADHTVQEIVVLKALTDVFAFPKSTQNFLDIPNLYYARLNTIFNLKPYEFVEAGDNIVLKNKNKARLENFIEDLHFGTLPANISDDRAEGHVALLHSVAYKIRNKIFEKMKNALHSVTKADIENPFHPISTIFRLCETVISDGSGFSLWRAQYPTARCARGVYVDCLLSIASILGQKDGAHLPSTLFKHLDCGE